MSEPIVRTISALTHGRFLLQLPDARPPYRLLVGFHGYGENAERHLDQLRQIPGASGWLLASVQALHRFYSGRFEDVVACWMTRQDREQAIEDNVAYVDRVIAEICREHEVEHVVFCGFSQGTAMAYRAALLGSWPSPSDRSARGTTRQAAPGTQHEARGAPSGIIALGGDFPPELRDRPALAFPPVLIGRGANDGWYTDEKLREDVGHLRHMGVAVRAVVFDGGHEWTDQFREAAGQFLRSVIEGPTGRIM